jgi:hypothetical protein
MTGELQDTQFCNNSKPTVCESNVVSHIARTLCQLSKVTAHCPGKCAGLVAQLPFTMTASVAELPHVHSCGQSTAIDPMQRMLAVLCSGAASSVARVDSD